jgi:hypothetical protein
MISTHPLIEPVEIKDGLTLRTNFSQSDKLSRTQDCERKALADGFQKTKENRWLPSP